MSQNKMPGHMASLIKVRFQSVQYIINCEHSNYIQGGGDNEESGFFSTRNNMDAI